MSELETRVQCKSLLKKLMKAEETIQFFKNGMNLGWSGFTPAGYPKEVPIALADYVEANGLQGKLKFNLFIGASVGAETEDRWATLNMIDRRWPYQTGKNIAKGINSGEIRMGDKHLSLFAQDLGYGFYTKDTESGKLDLAIIEVSAIKEDGSLVPTSSCGVIPEILMVCDRVILEVNTGQPSFEGMHDLITPGTPPNRQVFDITKADSRIGSTSIPCDPNKVIAIVESKRLDKGRAFTDRPTKTDPTGITCVVPKAPHIDHTEHDLDVLVTDQGLADLRGLAPKQRAQAIIDKCVHPDYKDIIQDYFDMASKICLANGVGHEPQLFDRCFKMQMNLAKNGTMKIDNWDVPEIV